MQTEMQGALIGTFSRRLLVAAFVFCGCSATLHAASFNCAKASTPQEKAICANPKLSALDGQVAASYAALRNQLSANGAAEVQSDQRAWLVWLRAVCPVQQPKGETLRDCLTAKYNDRLPTLKASLHRIDGMVLFDRYTVLTMPNTEPPPSDGYFPGVGMGEFAWPEIDKPTVQQAAWNSAVRAQAVRLSFDSEQQAQPRDFATSSVADAEVTVTGDLRAVSKTLIVLQFHTFVYNYGAAHPSSGNLSFLWWLDKGRVLAASDVFRESSGWQDGVGSLAYNKLLHSDVGSYLWPESPNGELPAGRKAVLKEAQKPSNWVLSINGLEINFPSYSVGPYVMGRPCVQLSWNELRPYLAAGFDPATLPPALPQSDSD
jgi:uncharacterized protein